MMNEAPKLHHEQLDAYKAAIEFLALATTILARYPKGKGTMKDQLRRASLSIPLNIAEGYGKRTTPDRNKFYDIARGRAHEPEWTKSSLLDGVNVGPRARRSRAQ
jgi:four helix bundle protein